MNPVVRIRDLSVDFASGGETVRAVSGVSFDIEKGRPWRWWARAAPENR